MFAAGMAGHFGYRFADRMPGEGRWPRCVFCLAPLRAFNVIPLFGWLLRRGSLSLSCPCERRKGLWHQPIVELAGLVLGAGAASAAPEWNPSLFFICLGLGILPAMVLIDLAFGIIPDELNLALGICGFLWLLSGGGDVFVGMVTAGGMLAFGLLLALGYSKLRGREMLGLGDVKFFTAAGLWLPFVLVPWFLALSGVMGAAMGMAWKKSGGGKEFPFAPALCVALAALVLFNLYWGPFSLLPDESSVSP